MTGPRRACRNALPSIYDELLFPVYIDPDGSGYFVSLEWPGFEIVGAPEVGAVRLLAPGASR